MSGLFFGVVMTALSVLASVRPSGASEFPMPTEPPSPSALERNGVAAETYSRHRRAEFIATATHRPWVWEVSDGKNVAWIAGCLHLGAEAESNAFPAYLPYYERAAAVYFEVMPGAWDNPDIGTLLNRRGFAPDRRNLSGRISSESWRDVRIALQGDPVLFSRIKPMEPWLASLTLSQAGYRRAGLLREFGLEYFLEERARGDHKPVGALEKPQDQIFAMADAAMEDQERSLQTALINYAKADFGSEEIRRAWRCGDEAKLKGALRGGNPVAEGEMDNNLLARRNQNWARKIVELLSKGRPFMVAVGVEHVIAAPQSLPAILRTSGLNVQRVAPRAATTAVNR
ncbi:MAG: uncharacterized protein QOE70_445 [Chthoniobacter sp.]|jgi:uncharacterized protein YbaP (TraB family)|nr:uncharacterized protein [Chthoniobacter sp.]